MKHARIQLLTMVFILTLMVAPQAFAFTFAPIDVPDAMETSPNGINDQGQIVGYYFDSNFISHGFLLDRGNLTTIDVPAAMDTFLLGINDQGQIVGIYDDADFNFYNFLMDKKGKLSQTDIAIPSNVSTFVSGINASGHIVGNTQTPVINDFFYVLGFVMDKKGNFTTFGYPDPYGFSQAIGINDAGQIVGLYVSNTEAGLQQHGFLRDKNGTFTAIDFPGAMGTNANGINDAGQIVGDYFNADGNYHGFLLDKGKFTTVDFPGAIDTFLGGINASGQIVGVYVDTNFISHGFLMAP